jgi:putative transposase
LPGGGKALMDQWSRLRWRWRPLDRIRRIGEKNGTKRSLLVDGNGIPLSSVVDGAQRHDVKLLEPTLDGIVVDRPSEEEGPKQHLCADKGYAGQPAQESMQERGYVPHVRQRGEEALEKKRNPRRRARRWVVERVHSWLNRFRKLLVRYEKTTASYEGLLELACSLIAFRQVITIYG